MCSPKHHPAPPASVPSQTEGLVGVGGCFPAGFGVGCSWGGRQCPHLILLRSHTLAWVPVAQAPAQSSVWGCFIWGQTSLISQLGPASDQRAAFISQGSGQPPGHCGHYRAPKISLQWAKAFGMPEPARAVSWGHVLPCTRWELHLQGLCAVFAGTPRSPPHQHSRSERIQPCGSHRDSRNSFCAAGKGSFPFSPVVFPCGGGVHVRVCDVLTH